MPNTDEKKDDPAAEKGDKGHAAEQKQKDHDDNPSPTAGGGRHAGHRRRKGGNPDASND